MNEREWTAMVEAYALRNGFKIERIYHTDNGTGAAGGHWRAIIVLPGGQRRRVWARYCDNNKSGVEYRGWYRVGRDSPRKAKGAQS